MFENQGQSPIGIPLPETRVYVCDEHKHLQPIGVRGELYVGGTGVSRGYLNREMLTSERFVQSPFRPGETLYRTGDVGRWLENGTLEFFGRNDDQVQIRGYRVELGETEACLAAHNFVEKAVVIARDTDKGIKELTAYVTSPDNVRDKLNVSILRDHLKKNASGLYDLYFIPLEKFPLTSNNKVDRRALPPPEGVRPRLSEDYVNSSDRC